MATNSNQRTKTNALPVPPAARDRIVARRVAKVTRLLESVRGETADQLEAYSGMRRRAFAEAAGVNDPSDETWETFVHALRVRAAEADTDPMEGLPQ